MDAFKLGVAFLLPPLALVGRRTGGLPMGLPGGLGAVAIGSMNGKDFAAMFEKAIERSGTANHIKQIETTCEEVAPVPRAL